MQHQFQQSLFMNPCVLQFINRMVDIPAVCNLVRTVHAVQQTVDFHRYSSSMAVYAPVVVQRQVPWLGRAQTVEFRSCRLSGVAQCLVRL